MVDIKTTRTIIGILFRDYWATEEQRDKIIKFQQQERMRAEKEKKEEYSTENLFKNNIKTTENETNQIAFVEYKEDKWYKRLIMKINKLFKR